MATKPFQKTSLSSFMGLWKEAKRLERKSAKASTPQGLNKLKEKKTIFSTSLITPHK